MDDALVINSVDFCYDSKKVFEGLSLNIKKETFSAILALNGMGKTTLMKILFGDLSYNGYISLNHKHLSSKNIKEIRRQVGFIFDDLDNSLVFDDVLDELVFNLENLSMTMEEIDNRLKVVNDFMKIDDFTDKEVSSLNFYEKIKLALAKAIAQNVKVLVIDDVLKLVSNEERKELLETLKKLKSLKMTIIYLTSNLEETLLCDNIYFLHNKKILLSGNVAIFQNEIWDELKIPVPFNIKLSTNLKKYGITDKVYKNMKDIVNDIWPSV